MLTHDDKEDWRFNPLDFVTDFQELFELLALDSAQMEALVQDDKHFPLRVPRGFVARMKKKDIDDPLLRQILPLKLETQVTADYLPDPLKEQDKNPLPGLLHKFHGRVLLIVTAACGIHCRYCFRQHFPYSANNPGRNGWKAVMHYIQQDPTISEVILSGGDPLVVTNQYLSHLIEQLDAIPQLKRLRIHSRMPIILPERINSKLVDVFTKSRLKTVFVMHCNHAQEIDQTVKSRMKMLAEANITLLNQSVLLKGINDNVEALTDLSESLFDCDILPYYLFLLDKVKGAAHFDLSLEQARQLHQALTRRLPGYLVPKLARELPGYPAKVLII